MSAKADVTGYLDRRAPKIAGAIAAWTDSDETAGPRSAVVESYFENANLGDTQRIGANSLYVERCRAPEGAPTVLVIGNHDTSDLVPGISGPAHAEAGYVGAGVGSRFGPSVAFLEGFKASLEGGLEEPINFKMLSVGQDERLDTNLGSIATDDIDAVFFTNAISWDPLYPTITTGARGRLLAEITITAGRAVNDVVFAGAVRNPLNRLSALLGSLRDDKGKIAIPGFYHRAQPPNAEIRSQMRRDDFDPDAWLTGLDLSRPGGSLSALERATLWPVVSIMGVTTDDANLHTTPASASAQLAIYLVPDQRPVEIEAALRSWVESRVPANMSASVSLLSMARPYRSSSEQQVVAAQSRAASRVHGRSAILVPGGGAIGAGEVHFLTGAPVGFAGICGPQHGYGSTHEALPEDLLERAIAHAAETCLQLPRRTALRSTS